MVAIARGGENLPSTSPPKYVSEVVDTVDGGDDFQFPPVSILAIWHDSIDCM